VNTWDLVLAHRFQEALAAYDATISASHVVSYLDLANRATVQLCLGQLPEALAGFQRANVLAGNDLAKDHSAYLHSIGVVQWLLGDRQGAVHTFKAAAEGVLTGSIIYADNAGGVSQGLLLFYAGITSKDQTATEFSVKYLGKLAEKTRIAYWPGPLALLVLGLKPITDILTDCFGTTDLRQATQMSQQDLLRRRELVQVLFYVATMEREAGKDAECFSRMVECTRVPNPILELEWYLARAEASRT
jgi:hypothetical protein